ncbi:N-acetyltransferase 6 [Eumeta japonica]|uniref:N-acetyltransferase 6 n=1 Tax=Eumeta variegata TaxID=151549 RepID=A0A4C1V2A5_EUMVA|nr:N-acetyltransferase 6 [Eumeta japonica]
MDFDDLHVVPIHKYPYYFEDCCKLINAEWPRSETARMMSLKASCDTLPTSLVLVTSKNNVIGHCKLQRIPSIPESCFIESVVIDKALRGKKLGTHLMKETENYCRNVLKLIMIHLSTRGQEQFYAKLGYKVCKPVSIYGHFIPNTMKIPPISQNDYKSSLEGTDTLMVQGPPPPPMPKIPIFNDDIKSNKIFMIKYL